MRAEQPFLLAAPEGDADGAARLDVERLQDAHGLHGHRRPGRVVGGAGAGVPGIEVGAEHHDLALLVRARDLRDRVVGGRVLVVEARADVQLQLHVHLAVQEAGQAVVLLGRHHQRRHARVLALDPGAAASHQHDPRVRRADLDGGQRLLRDEERPQETLEAQPPRRRLAVDGRAPGRRHVEAREVVELLLGVAQELRLLGVGGVARIAQEHDAPGELAAVLLRVRLRLDLDLDDLAALRPVRARGVAARHGEQRRRRGLDHLDHRALERPAAAELEPLEVRVGEAPRLQPLARPVVGLAASAATPSRAGR